MSTDPAAKGGHAQRIGKYEVIKHIASGGMGAVYRAKDVELGREVALKVLSPQMDPTKRRTRLERFRLEALNAARLRHPNIAAIYDCGGEKGLYWLALEFVDGPDLHEYIARKGKLDFEESRSLIVQAIKALAHLHRNALVHRDIKPANFIVTEKDAKPVIKLIDLGLARRTTEPDDTEYRVTKDGATLGTIDYMAPEQARDSTKADIRSDIYALGCTWYHMLAGKPPFPDGTMMERLYKHLQVEPPDVRQFNDTVPEAAIPVLKRMLAKDQAQRYQTPAELLKDLAKAQPRPGAGPAGASQEEEVVEGVLVQGEDISEGVPIEDEATPSGPGPRKRSRSEETEVAEVDDGEDADQEFAEYDDDDDKPQQTSDSSRFVQALLQDSLFWLAVGVAAVVVFVAFIILLR